MIFQLTLRCLDRSIDVAQTKHDARVKWGTSRREWRINSLKVIYITNMFIDLYLVLIVQAQSWTSKRVSGCKQYTHTQLPTKPCSSGISTGGLDSETADRRITTLSFLGIATVSSNLRLQRTSILINQLSTRLYIHLP